MAVKKATAKAEPTKTAQKFPLEVLLKAKIFANRKDALGAVIKQGETLTIDEAKTRLENFLKGEVK